MSKINVNATDVRNKKVDYKVYSSRNDAIVQTTEENSGYLNVIMNPDIDDYALYIGDAHIASGYGLSSPEAVRSLEEFLNNENIKKLLQEIDSHNEDPTHTDPSDVEIEDSFVNVNNSTISFTNGKLDAKSWINIYNITLVLSNGETLYKDKEYVFDVTNNDIYVRQIIIDYDIKDSSINSLKWKLDFSTEGLPQNSVDRAALLSGGTSFDVTADGTRKRNETITCNSLLPKNNSLVYKHPINLIIKNDTNEYEFIKICDIEYKYKIYLTIDTDPITNNTNYALYDSVNGCELSINLDHKSYLYVWVPSVLSDTNFSCIYKDSSIACKFESDSKALMIGNNISYDRYKSPWQYFGNMTWIIK